MTTADHRHPARQPPVLEVTRSPPPRCYVAYQIQVLQRATPKANPTESSEKPELPPPSRKKPKNHKTQQTQITLKPLHEKRCLVRRGYFHPGSLQARRGCAEIPPLRKSSHEAASPQPPHLRTGEKRRNHTALAAKIHINTLPRGLLTRDYFHTVFGRRTRERYLSSDTRTSGFPPQQPSRFLTTGPILSRLLASPKCHPNMATATPSYLSPSRTEGNGRRSGLDEQPQGLH